MRSAGTIPLLLPFDLYGLFRIVLLERTAAATARMADGSLKVRMGRTEVRPMPPCPLGYENSYNSDHVSSSDATA